MARRGAPAVPSVHLARLFASLALADAALALAAGPQALAVLLLVAGCWIAPAFATLYGLVTGVARPGTTTESYTWLATGLTTGAAAGAAAAGGLMEVAPAAAGFAGAALVAAAGAAIVAANQATLAAAAGTDRV